MNLTAVVMGAYGKIARNMVHSAKLVHQRLDKRGKVRVDGAVFFIGQLQVFLRNRW